MLLEHTSVRVPEDVSQDQCRDDGVVQGSSNGDELWDQIDRGDDPQRGERDRELGSPWHLAVVLADHADYCAAAGDTVIARTLADEARIIATQLGARPLLQRLDRAFATVD